MGSKAIAGDGHGLFVADSGNVDFVGAGLDRDAFEIADREQDFGLVEAHALLVEPIVARGAAGGGPGVGQDHDAGERRDQRGARELAAEIVDAQPVVLDVVAGGRAAVRGRGGEHVGEFFAGGLKVGLLGGELLAGAFERGLGDDAEARELFHLA